MRRWRTGPFLFSIATVALSACSDAAGPGSLDTAELPVSASLTGTAITSIVIEVTAADIDQALLFNLTRSGDVASGTLSVPAGPARTFDVRGHSDGTVTHEGSATVDVHPGENEPLVVTLMARPGVVPVEIHIGNVFITVTPSADTLEVGALLQLLATLTDGNGNPIEQVPAWATGNPAIATVDGTGQVTAVSPGDVSIAATYAGVMGLARIHIPGATPGACESNFGQDVVAAVNAVRADSGLSALLVDVRLVAAAEAHSADMAATGTLSHTGSDGSTFVTRTEAQGYFGVRGEVIGLGATTGQAMVDLWMDSDTHRAILLSASSLHIGVGYASDGQPYWTADLGSASTLEAPTGGCHPAI